MKKALSLAQGYPVETRHSVSFENNVCIYLSHQRQKNARVCSLLIKQILVLSLLADTIRKVSCTSCNILVQLQNCEPLYT